MFVREARAAAAKWKQTTDAIPEAARADGAYPGYGSYPFVLPIEFAECNLLDDARTWALDYFDAAEIPWHGGSPRRPSNHLLSSQVQCVNALAPLAYRPDALRALFGEALGIDEVLPAGDPIDPNACMAFEWIGAHNVLGEWKDGVGTRGAKNTSADAAIRYRAADGATELALIEWKYTESYLGEKAELDWSATSKRTRDARYRHLFDHIDGPLRTDVIPYDDCYVEPFYQLMRLSLLAWQTELVDPTIDRARVVYCAPARNAELWASLSRPSHVGDVKSLWNSMQRRRDRFVCVDTAALVADDAPTSFAFKDRYGHLGGQS